MENQAKPVRLNRREFLKTGLLAAGTAAAAPLLSAFNRLPAGLNGAAMMGTKMYRGTQDGRVLESSDGGNTWQQIANLGPAYAVESVQYTQGVLLASAIFQGRAFRLKSVDGRRWYTLEWTAPRS